MVLCTLYTLLPNFTTTLQRKYSILRGQLGTRPSLHPQISLAPSQANSFLLLSSYYSTTIAFADVACNFHVAMLAAPWRPSYWTPAACDLVDQLSIPEHSTQLSAQHTPGFPDNSGHLWRLWPRPYRDLGKGSGATLLGSYSELLHLLTMTLSQIFHLSCPSLLHRVAEKIQEWIHTAHL